MPDFAVRCDQNVAISTYLAIGPALHLDRPLVMGILNVTPDSFSDGGLRSDSRDAIAAGLAMAADGADIIDVGGESTRPGAAPVPPGVEQDRVLPVIRALAADGLCVSVDTRNAVHDAGSARGGCQDRQRCFRPGP